MCLFWILYTQKKWCYWLTILIPMQRSLLRLCLYYIYDFSSPRLWFVHTRVLYFDTNNRRQTWQFWKIQTRGCNDICYEARTLQNECRACVGHMSDTDTCKTFVRHVSHTLMLCRILNNYKITCRHRVQRRVGIK